MNARRSYALADGKLTVLDGLSLRILRGRTHALLGASGSGKTTLLHILGLLDRPESGRFLFGDWDVLHANARQLAALRNQEIGFVFQAFHLLPHLSAEDNVALPLTYRGMHRAAARKLAAAQMADLGLAKHLKHRPDQLSGGQCQRVAIARALVGEPSLILADEPTGNLDDENAEAIFSLLLRLNRERGTTLVMVTHDQALAQGLEYRIEIRQGQAHGPAEVVGGRA